VDLVGVDEGRKQIVRDRGGHLDPAVDRLGKEGGHLPDHVPEVHGRHSAGARREKSRSWRTSWTARSAALIPSAIGAAAGEPGGTKPRAKVQAAEDPREDVVEVVRDTPCQGPDRFHLLHLDQLLFEQAPFRDVDPGHDDGDDRPGAVVQRGMVPRDRPRRSVGGDDRGFERWRRAPRGHRADGVTVEVAGRLLDQQGPTSSFPARRGRRSRSPPRTGG